MPPRHLETSEPELLRRILEFGDRIGQGTAERVEPVEGGHVVLNPSADLLHDASYVAVTDPGIGAGALVETARAIADREGIGGIEVAPMDSGDGERLAPGFDLPGWKTEQGIYMVHRREPDGPALHEVSEHHGNEVADFLWDLIKETWSGDYDGDPDKVTAQFVARERAYAELGGDHWFVAGDDEGPAAVCYLIEREGWGQVETVASFERARNKGLARSVMLAAIEESESSGNELTFIGAEADDWPWKLYEKLGFDPIGVETVFSFRRPRA
ncbi:MAG: GNAT family N-acetyltransferase [Actinomycetota bacterium]|nr:GNAT family N-acetyltransferase [Actinomycetota bacterium]